MSDATSIFQVSIKLQACPFLMRRASLTEECTLTDSKAPGHDSIHFYVSEACAHTLCTPLCK